MTAFHCMISTLFVFSRKILGARAFVQYNFWLLTARRKTLWSNNKDLACQIESFSDILVLHSYSFGHPDKLVLYFKHEQKGDRFSCLDLQSDKVPLLPLQLWVLWQFNSLSHFRIWKTPPLTCRGKARGSCQQGGPYWQDPTVRTLNRGPFPLASRTSQKSASHRRWGESHSSSGKSRNFSPKKSGHPVWSEEWASLGHGSREDRWRMGVRARLLWHLAVGHQVAGVIRVRIRIFRTFWLVSILL